ncbi:MAG: NAD(P)/FAD-dependent oxidoreductase [Isosphaeraceae bacterium]
MSRHEPEPYDLVVVGGGMGGLATAALAQRVGLRVALLEAHTKLGGCAGYFERGGFTFDAGATALMGLGADEPLGRFLGVTGVNLPFTQFAGYRVHLPDRSLEIAPDPGRFEQMIARVFPGDFQRKRDFWRLQHFVGSTLFRASSGIPRLPLRSVSDLIHDLRILGPRGALAGATWTVTVRDVLRFFGVAGDRAFVAFVAMLLQDTVQAGPDVVPFANAAACLHAYRAGMSRPTGGMKALGEGIGSRFAAMGGDLRTASLVDRVEESDGGVTVHTRRRERLRARQVVLNLPIDRAAALLGRSLSGRLGRAEQRSQARWSAFTAYLAIDREVVPDTAPLFHHILQDYSLPIHDGNNALVSLAAPDDEGYGPSGVRVATMSTHTRPDGWFGLDGAAYRARKAEYSTRLLSALERALPGATSHLKHVEFASPRSFLRYVRRANGAVGGPPVRRSNSLFLAVGSDVLGPGLWLVGDSVFPGQGTMATVLSAIRAVERISGMSWNAMVVSGDEPTPEARMAPCHESPWLVEGGRGR